MEKSIQFSVTKQGRGYIVLVQNEKEVIRTYRAEEKTILRMLEGELKELVPVKEK